MWQISAFAITLAWINLLLHMRQLPLIGKYITIFHDVLYTFLKCLIILGVFIIAFGLGFHILLGYQAPFDQPQDSILKTLIMMSGEFEYQVKLNKIFLFMSSYILKPLCT